MNAPPCKHGHPGWKHSRDRWGWCRRCAYLAMRRWRDKVRLVSPVLALDVAQDELRRFRRVQIELVLGVRKLNVLGWGVRLVRGRRSAVAFCTPRTLPWQFRERVRRAVEAL